MAFVNYSGKTIPTAEELTAIHDDKSAQAVLELFRFKDDQKFTCDMLGTTSSGEPYFSMKFNGTEFLRLFARDDGALYIFDYGHDDANKGTGTGSCYAYECFCTDNICVFTRIDVSDDKTATWYSSCENTIVVENGELIPLGYKYPAHNYSNGDMGYYSGAIAQGMNKVAGSLYQDANMNLSYFNVPYIKGDYSIGVSQNVYKLLNCPSGITQKRYIGIAGKKYLVIGEKEYMGFKQGSKVATLTYPTTPCYLIDIGEDY